MKIEHKYKFLTIVPILLLSSTFSVNNLCAAPPPDDLAPNKIGPTSMRVFSIHDTDKNGSLSRDEYLHFVKHIEERRKSTGRPMRRFSTTLLFEEIDTNSDEVLTEDEMISALNIRLRKHRRYRYKGSKTGQPGQGPK